MKGMTGNRFTRIAALLLLAAPIALAASDSTDALKPILRF